MRLAPAARGHSEPAGRQRSPAGLVFGAATGLRQLPHIAVLRMRLLKMKDSRSAGERHCLESTASEGMVWRWVAYAPGGPPLHSPGEFSVQVEQGVDGLGLRV